MTKMIEYTRLDGTTYTRPFDKLKWKQAQRNYRALNCSSVRLIEASEQKQTKQTKQTFKFKNGMIIEYTGKRTDVNGAYIAVYQGEIVYKGFSNKGKSGAEKAGSISYGSSWNRPVNFRASDLKIFAAGK